VAIRADASIQIGSGHVMRCLTLANKLKQTGAEIVFICRDFSGNLIEFIQSQGFVVLTLSQSNQNDLLSQDHSSLKHALWLGGSQQADARQTIDQLDGLKVDWMIVDHYALDFEWETLLQPYYENLFVIDDLADRAHIATILLDQNLGRTIQDYQHLIQPCCQCLLGADYALLREEFLAWREISLQHKSAPTLNSILVNLGGVDADNVTGEVIEVLANTQVPGLQQVQVVMGNNAPHIELVKQQIEQLNRSNQVHVIFNLLTGVNNMAQLMAESDFAIGAAGSTTWERCCLGLPSIMIVIAENQQVIAQQLEKARAAKIVSLPLKSVLGSELQNLSKHDLMALIKNSTVLVDGQGCDRVLEKMHAVQGLG